jgi:chromosome segregation ATPase
MENVDIRYDPDDLFTEMKALAEEKKEELSISEDEEDEINFEYEKAKDSLDETIDQLDSVYDRIEDHSSVYPSGKIQHDSSVVGDLREFCRVADRISQPTAKFVLGYDREGRSSLYSTLQENIDDRRQELESRETDLGEHTNRFQSLADRTKTKIDDIDSAYATIEASSVNIDLPRKDAVKDTVEERCETVLEEVKSELPGLDFSNKADDIRDIQDEWDEMLTDARQDIDEVFQVVDQLERLAGEIGELETERESRRTQLQTLSEHMEVNDE